MGLLQVGANVVALEQAVRVDFKTAVDKLQMRDVLSFCMDCRCIDGNAFLGLISTLYLT